MEKRTDSPSAVFRWGVAAVVVGACVLAYLGIVAVRHQSTLSSVFEGVSDGGFSSIGPALSWLDREWGRSPGRFAVSYGDFLAEARRRNVPVNSDSLLRAMESSHSDFCRSLSGANPVPEEISTYCEARLRPFVDIPNPAPSDWVPPDCGSYRSAANRDACAKAVNETLSRTSDRHCSSAECLNDHAGLFALMGADTAGSLCAKHRVPAMRAGCESFVSRLLAYRSAPSSSGALFEIEALSWDPVASAAREAVYSDDPASECSRLSRQDAERCEALVKTALERIESDRETRRFRRIVSVFESSK